MKKENKTMLSNIESGVVGAALGVAAGMALAPESGKKFRDDIKKKVLQVRAYLKKTL